MVNEKLILESGLIREVVIWSVEDPKKYPDGIRYRLVLVDSLKKQTLVLFDNHFPKGHHKHIGLAETPYRFMSLSKLVSDFIEECQRQEELKNEN